MSFAVFLVSLVACCHLIFPLFSETDRAGLKKFPNLPVYTARNPPVDPAAATITAALAMHAGHICSLSEILFEFQMVMGTLGSALVGVQPAQHRWMSVAVPMVEWDPPPSGFPSTTIGMLRFSMASASG